jgi:hypothetical protein
MNCVRPDTEGFSCSTTDLLDPRVGSIKGKTSEVPTGANVRFVRGNQMPAWLRNVSVRKWLGWAAFLGIFVLLCETSDRLFGRGWTNVLLAGAVAIFWLAILAAPLLRRRIN